MTLGSRCRWSPRTSRSSLSKWLALICIPTSAMGRRRLRMQRRFSGSSSPSPMTTRAARLRWVRSLIWSGGTGLRCEVLLRNWRASAAQSAVCCAASSNAAYSLAQAVMFVLLSTVSSPAATCYAWPFSILTAGAVLRVPIMLLLRYLLITSPLRACSSTSRRASGTPISTRRRASRAWTW